MRTRVEAEMTPRWRRIGGGAAAVPGELRGGGDGRRDADVGVISGRSRVISGTLAQAWLLLDEMEMQWVPLSYTWRLNERHYGPHRPRRLPRPALSHYS